MTTSAVKGTAAPKPDRLFSKDYVLVIIASTSTAFMNFFFATSTALHIAAFGGLQIYAGLIATVYTTAAFIMRPVAGILSDKYGRVKLLILGSSICAVCCFFYGIAGSIVAFLIIRAFKGIGFGTNSTCAGAIAADVLPKSRLAEGIGIFGLGGTIGQAIAPMIAIIIIGDGSLENYRTLFFAAAGLSVLGTVAGCCITYERKRKKTVTRAVPDDTGRETLELAHEAAHEAALEAAVEETVEDAGGKTADENTTTTDDNATQEKNTTADENMTLPKTLFGFEYAVFAPLAAMVLLCMSYSALIMYIPPYAKGLGVGNPGLYFLICATGSFASRMVLGKVADRRGNDPVIIPAIAFLAVLLATLAFIKSLPALLVYALLIGFAQGAASPTFNSLMFKRCTPARRGTASGASASAFDIGVAIGAPLFGLIADTWDFRYVFWASSVCLVLSLGVYLLTASDRVYNAKIFRRHQAASR